jgi:hypothetical protein
VELDHVPGLLSRTQRSERDFQPRSLRERLDLGRALRFTLAWTLAGVGFNLAQRALDPALDWLFQQWEVTKWLAN